jgi:hypothetical protein
MSSFERYSRRSISSANLILLGDYNDDVDFIRIICTYTVSTYEAYVNDSANIRVYKTLSEQGLDRMLLLKT